MDDQAAVHRQQLRTRAPNKKTPAAWLEFFYLVVIGAIEFALNKGFQRDSITKYSHQYSHKKDQHLILGFHYIELSHSEPQALLNSLAALPAL